MKIINFKSLFFQFITIFVVYVHLYVLYFVLDSICVLFHETLCFHHTIIFNFIHRKVAIKTTINNIKKLKAKYINLTKLN